MNDRHTATEASEPIHGTRQQQPVDLLDVPDDVLANILRKALHNWYCSPVDTPTGSLLSVCDRFRRALSEASETSCTTAWLDGNEGLNVRDCRRIDAIVLTGKPTTPFWRFPDDRPGDPPSSQGSAPACDVSRLTTVTRLELCHVDHPPFDEQLLRLTDALPQLRAVAFKYRETADLIVPRLTKLTALGALRVDVLSPRAVKGLSFPALRELSFSDSRWDGGRPVGRHLVEGSLSPFAAVQVVELMRPLDYRLSLVATLARLADLPALRRAFFHNVEFDRDATEGPRFALSHLARLTELEHVAFRVISYPVEWDMPEEVGDVPETLKCLAEIPALRRLTLEGKAITDAHMAAVASVQRLTAIDVIDTFITDAGILQLAKLPALRKLAFQRSERFHVCPKCAPVGVPTAGTVTQDGLAQLAVSGVRIELRSDVIWPSTTVCNHPRTAWKQHSSTWACHA